MDCTEIRPLISYYHDGEATPEERTRVERHLAGCEDCRHVLAEYRAISGGMRQMALPAPPVGLRRDVWRAIEAQQAGAGARTFGAPDAGTAANKKRDKGTVVQFPQNRRKATFAGALANLESGWSKALTAALVIGALFIVMGVLIVLQNRPQLELAQIEETQALVDYGQPVHIKFGKAVISNDVIEHTTVWKTDAASSAFSEVKDISKTWMDGINGKLEIKPNIRWEAGVTYKVNIDAPNIGLGTANDKLGKEVVEILFSTVAHTPTPTETPTITPIPTEIPAPPIPTREPTVVADNTPLTNVEPTVTPQVEASATPEPPQPTATIVIIATTAPRPSATNTRPAPPTATAIAPTSTPAPQPSATATQAGPTATETTAPPKPTSTVIVTATATAAKGTPTATLTLTPTPIKGTPTPAQPCTIMPANGFGKIWNELAEVRNRIGCPKEYETALQEAAEERFLGGYMFWRGDIKMIYVFLWGSANDSVGTWLEFPDTWREGDVEPTPTGPVRDGSYTPMRGFGKLWRENASLRLALGDAIEPERAVIGAWQTYDRGYALWTENKTIRFMFKDNITGSNIWMRFEDTYVMPTATPTK